MPWDSGTSFRPGARFGPEGVRSASALLRPYNPAQDVQVFGARLVRRPRRRADRARLHRGHARAHRRLRRGRSIAAGAIPLGIGGDHSVTLAELRAAAAVHGPLGLVHLDSHHDVWDSYFGRPLNHGTVFRRACEEGLLDPARCLQAGMRGGLYSGDDYAASTELGMEIVPWSELRTLSADEFGERARARLGDGPAFFTFDVDFVDPAFCPGTGTPEVGGPTSAHALDLVRALRGIDFRAFDVVEVAPAYDGPGQVTALLAANVMFEILSLVALAR